MIDSIYIQLREKINFSLQNIFIQFTVLYNKDSKSNQIIFHFIKKTKEKKNSIWLNICHYFHIQELLRKIRVSIKNNKEQQILEKSMSIVRNFSEPQTIFKQNINKQLKNKKIKPSFQAQIDGLKQLFKFYCGLNSQFQSQSKQKDLSKGTFDQFQSKMSNMSLHNFMLFCKDFSIIQQKKQPKSRLLKFQQSNNQKDKAAIIWDRDSLSKNFKKQADYTFNLNYDKFIQILKRILNQNIVFQVGNKGQEDLYLDMIRICKFLNVDTECNFKKTMQRLKLNYKILSPKLSSNILKRREIRSINGHFEQKFLQSTSNRKMQKQKKRLVLKEKYLSKFFKNQIDSYSSFSKKSNIQKNSKGNLKLKMINNENFPNQDQLKLKTSENRGKLGSDSNLGLSNVIKAARRQNITEKQTAGYGKMHILKLMKGEKKLNLSQILSNPIKSREQNNTSRQTKKKLKTNHLNIFLKRIGCNQEDQLLNKYFEIEKRSENSHLTTTFIR